MDPQEELVLFLEENPELYEVMKSKLFMNILAALMKKPSTLHGLAERFPRIEMRDLEEIVDLLYHLQLLEKIEAGAVIVYHVSEKGKAFLTKYMKTEQEFFGKPH
jgi:predicted transcriptional regulator